jgi:hypothetical protein
MRINNEKGIMSMTRKRFIKLLMEEGYSRNSANNIANSVLKDGYSYAEGYDQINRLLPLVQAMIPNVIDFIEKATTAIAKVATAVVEAARAAVDAFSAAMSQT